MLRDKLLLIPWPWPDVEDKKHWMLWPQMLLKFRVLCWLCLWVVQTWEWLLIYFCETAWTHAYQSALVTLIIFLGFQFLGVGCIWRSSRPHLPSVLKRFHTCPWPVNEIPTTAVTVTVIAKAGTEKSKPWIKFRIDWSLYLCQPTLEIYALGW